MSKPKELKISETTRKYIDEALEKCASALKQQMKIAEIDHLQVHLDLNFHSTGKFCGVKFSALQLARAEVIYDKDIKGGLYD